MIFLNFVLAMFALPLVQAQAQTTDDSDWTMAVRLGSADAYLSYLLRNPTGQHVSEAVIALRALGAIVDPDSALVAAEEAARRPPAKQPVRTQPKSPSPSKPAVQSKPAAKSIY